MIADWGRLTEERLPYRASELDQSLLGRLSHLGVFLSKTHYWNTPKDCVHSREMNHMAYVNLIREQEWETKAQIEKSKISIKM